MNIPFQSGDIIRNHSDGAHRWRTYEHRRLLSGHQLGWINNDTVLVVGFRKPEGRGIYAWNPGKRPRLILKDGYRFCFDGKTWTALVGIINKERSLNEYYRYQINPTSLAAIRLGKPQQLTSGPGRASYFTCNDEKGPESLHDRAWVILRPSDGFLDFGPIPSTNQNATLIKADMVTRQSTQIKPVAPLRTTVAYSIYSSTYLVYNIGLNPDDINKWRTTHHHTIWAMEPSGKTKAITMAAGPWLDAGSGDKFFAISRPGILISSKGLGQHQEHQAGVFLLRADNSHTRISAGSSERLSVSPNGCRVAWSVDRPKASGIGFASNLSAADLCQASAKESKAPTTPWK